MTDWMHLLTEKIPEDFGHVLRVCKLGDPNDFCKMDPMIFYATMEKDVYVDEVVVSAEIGDGEDAEYSPKKVRLFLWEGDFPEDYCRDECMEDRWPTFCSDDSKQILKNVCGEFDNNDSCKEYGSATDVVETCSDDEVCEEGECVEAPTFRILNCSKWVFANSECVANAICPDGYIYDSSFRVWCLEVALLLLGRLLRVRFVREFHLRRRMVVRCGARRGRRVVLLIKS